MHKKFQRTLTLGLLCSLAVLLTACTLPNLTELKEKAEGLIKKETQEAAQTTDIKENSESPFAPAKSEPTKSSGKLTALLGQKKNLRCTFAQVTPAGKSSSVFYTDGTNILIQSTMDEDSNIETNMLLKGKQYYVWNKPENKGIKMVIEETPEVSTQTAQGPLETLEDVEFKCEDWKLDATIFEAPSDVEFFETQGELSPEATPNLQ